MPLPEEQNVGIFFSISSKVGDSMTAATIVPNNSIKAYTMRVEVEFLHEGHALQHKLHAALPKQHASCPREHAPRPKHIVIGI